MFEKEGGESHRGPRHFRNLICLTPATSEKQDNSQPSWVEVTFLDKIFHRQMEEWEFLNLWINENPAVRQTGMFSVSISSHTVYCALSTESEVHANLYKGAHHVLTYFTFAMTPCEAAWYPPPYR